MSEITRRVQFPALPDFADLMDPLQLLLSLRQQPETFAMRLETHADQDAFVVRAEIPGIDPAKDLEITVTDGILTMHAQRTDRHTERHHTEFRYGTFSRSLRLPDGAKADKVTAGYQAGLLTIRVPLDKPVKAVSHKVPVKVAD